MKKSILLLAVCLNLTACANFRAGGTFEYVGDNMRPVCPADGAK